MEFDEHDDPDEEMEIPAAPPGYDSSSARAPPKAESEPSSAGARKSGGGGGAGFRYRECQKNHAVGIGGHAVDGCCEFMAAGEDGSLDALKCAACNCHRNFHRKEPLSPASSAANFHLFHHHHHHQPFPPSAAAPGPAAAAAYYRSPPTPSGYLHVRPPLALPGRDHDADDHLSNPSSSGGGCGGGGGGGSSSKKRFRTKFTQEQKEKMLEFAERVGWRIQKHDEAAVEQFCADTGVRRQVLKVWMHNNKHTLGKKP